MEGEIGARKCLAPKCTRKGKRRQSMCVDISDELLAEASVCSSLERYKSTTKPTEVMLAFWSL